MESTEVEEITVDEKQPTLRKKIHNRAVFYSCFPLVATLLGFSGSFHWFLDLFSHFRLQYTIALILFTIVYLLLKSWVWSSAALLFAFVNLTQVFPLYWKGSSVAGEPSESATAVLFNVNTGSGNPEQTSSILKETDPDIIVLMEISDDWLKVLQPVLDDYPHRCIKTRDDNFGIGVFSRLPMSQSEVVYIGNAGVPSVMTDISVGIHEVTLIATHPEPPVGAERTESRDTQLRELAEVSLEVELPLIVLGDLNTTPFSYSFQELLEDTGLINSARGYGYQPTWPSDLYLFPLRIPLDHCLHSEGVVVLDRYVGPHGGSDHFPLVVEFALAETGVIGE